ncbi:xylulose kinase [Rhodospirillaceae bacterium KN72]|uniref:Xylulose kinase n=1 Tax=Pacificispira spongiicola TaxID=2729598 RepID=A0A7Y0E215_9PROT|nr:FGGY family carbohydrate kinase [Pacificispira spongiicola]NMM45708.1 xylulose kinase [Pacificispira spongiicola]
MERAFIGIDAGTTGCTVMVFDPKGKCLGHGYKEYPTISPRSGWNEQNLDAVWDGICEASKAAIAQANLPAEAYKSVGVSSQRGTVCLLDKDKKPLADSIVWNDARAVEQADRIGESLPPEEHHDHTGMQLSPLWTASKIAWLRDKKPDLFEKIAWFANGQEYFLHRLGAEKWETDPASLTLNGMMDIAKLDWSDRILELCGIDRSRLPPVGIPTGFVGTVSKQASVETGIPVGVKLCRGAGDQQCAAIGAGVIRQGLAEFTVGTAAVMVAHLDSLDLIKGRNLWWGGHGVPNHWNIEGAAFSLGACLKWWRDNLGNDDIQKAHKEGKSPFAVMVDEAGEAKPGASGLLFHSFLSSQVTPYYDAFARGGYLGLGLHHNRQDLIRAMLEGCANEMKMVVDAFDSDIEGGVTELRLTGGGTKSPGFVQIMSDVFGRPVHVTSERECTVLGAAILGAVGAGEFTDVSEGVGEMVHLESSFEPNRDLAVLYTEQHGIYRDFYEAMAKGSYEKLNAFANKYC